MRWLAEASGRPPRAAGSSWLPETPEGRQRTSYRPRLSACLLRGRRVREGRSSLRRSGKLHQFVSSNIQPNVSGRKSRKSANLQLGPSCARRGGRRGKDGPTRISPEARRRTQSTAWPAPAAARGDRASKIMKQGDRDGVVRLRRLTVPTVCARVLPRQFRSRTLPAFRAREEKRNRGATEVPFSWARTRSGGGGVRFHGRPRTLRTREGRARRRSKGACSQDGLWSPTASTITTPPN